MAITGTDVSLGIAANEVQRVVVTGAFTLTFGGQTTSSISGTASAATVQTALEGLSSIGSGNVRVTLNASSTASTYIVSFVGSFLGTNVAQLTGSAATTITTVTSGASRLPIIHYSSPTLSYTQSYNPRTLVVLGYQNFTKNSTAKISSITDSAGNVYTEMVVSAGNASQGTLSLWYSYLIYSVTTSTTISVTTSGTQYAACVSCAFSNSNLIPDLSVADTTQSSVAAGGNWLTEGTAIDVTSTYKKSGILIGVFGWPVDYGFANTPASVRVATTANGTLSSAFANGQTVDGVVLKTGDRILIKNQTTASQNGVYTVNASGSPTRDVDFDTSAELLAYVPISVAEGTTNSATWWDCSNTTAITIGTTSITFTQITGASPSVFVDFLDGLNALLCSVAMSYRIISATASNLTTGLVSTTSVNFISVAGYFYEIPTIENGSRSIGMM